MNLISFDRDMTVETGHGPVEINVVERFVEHSQWFTYAHGNQMLVNEVSEITGMETVRKQSEVVHESGRFDSHASESLRENRLRAIRSLHPKVDRFICVDDVDLSNLDEWEYFYPSDFLDHYPEEFFPGS